MHADDNEGIEAALAVVDERRRVWQAKRFDASGSPRHDPGQVETELALLAKRIEGLRK